MVGFAKWAQGSVIKGGLVQIVRWDPSLATVGVVRVSGPPSPVVACGHAGRKQGSVSMLPV